MRTRAERRWPPRWPRRRAARAAAACEDAKTYLSLSPVHRRTGVLAPGAPFSALRVLTEKRLANRCPYGDAAKRACARGCPRSLISLPPRIPPWPRSPRLSWPPRYSPTSGAESATTRMCHPRDRLVDAIFIDLEGAPVRWVVRAARSRDRRRYSSGSAGRVVGTVRCSWRSERRAVEVTGATRTTSCPAGR